jgi:preprotein translocase subunit SecF
MIELIKSNTNIDFVSKFKVTGILSLIMVVVFIGIEIRSMEFGVDFRGGAEVQVKFSQDVNVTKLRQALRADGHGTAVVQSIGEPADNEYLVKVSATEEDLNVVADKIGALLNTQFSSSGAEVRKVDIVGPKAGANLRIAGFTAMAWALLAIMVYIGLRFDFKYSPGAITALIHDVVFILGIFAMFNIEFTLQTVAALLAVIGYSVNDTVIVYDRVREHEEKYAGKTLAEHINAAVNETLSRTVLTSGTTLFVSLAMLFFGGPAIKDFFLAITLGVFVGTYSSIFVAAPVTLAFDKFKAKA